jgi:Cu+-exporting ATPase
MSLYEKHAILYVDGTETEVEVTSLKVGDIVLVRNGSKFPVDGEVIKGTTTVDESTFTGESVPVNKDIGSKVLGGTISQGELILVRVTSTLEDSTVSQIVNSVKSVRADKSQPAKLAEKFSKYVLPFILISGLLALFVIGPLES